jgi:hypothetical protein
MFDSVDSDPSHHGKYGSARELPAWLAADLGVSPSIALQHRGRPSRVGAGYRRIAHAIRSVFGDHAVETPPRSSERRPAGDGTLAKLESRLDDAAEGTRAA